MFNLCRRIHPTIQVSHEFTVDVCLFDSSPSSVDQMSMSVCKMFAGPITTVKSFSIEFRQSKARRSKGTDLKALLVLSDGRAAWGASFAACDLHHILAEAARGGQCRCTISR